MSCETGGSRPDTRQARDGTCWECDTVTAALRRVVLPLPSGEARTLSVCEDCFETVYVPLLLAPSRIAD